MTRALIVLGLAGAAGVAVALTNREARAAVAELAEPITDRLTDSQRNALDAAAAGNPAALNFLLRDREAKANVVTISGGGGATYDRAPGYVQQAIRDNFPRSEWDNAARVSLCESNWNPNAHNTRGEDSRGLWQINIAPGANTDLARFNLFDPFQNGRAARIVWDRQGWGAWVHCARRNGLIA